NGHVYQLDEGVDRTPLHPEPPTEIDHRGPDPTMVSSADGSELKPLQSGTSDAPTSALIEKWEAQLQKTTTGLQRAAILNSREEWTALRERRYRGRKLLALCVEARRQELGRLLLCAAVYSEEVHALRLLTNLHQAAEIQRQLQSALGELRDG
ncbi:hypothetical protein PybrP1_007022, partial [[Pythium] brassicae (nom. inval.)]